MKKLILLLLIPFFSFSQIADDKVLHLCAGWTTSAASYAVVYGITKGDVKKSILYSTAFTLLVGALKETYDSTQPNNKFDVRDLGATIIGGLSFSLAISIPLSNNKRKHD